jgi:Coenzyme PQQ synthesis protein D (PqqD)
MIIAMYKKNKHVFWVQTDTGIVLQNINTNHFIELNKMQEKVWEYLDGTFSDEAILGVLNKHFVDIPKAELAKTVKSTFTILLDYDLISEN